MKNMDIKVKTALILVVTLLIGIVFGAFLYRAIFQGKVKGFLEMRTPDGFIRRFADAVDTTPEKKQEVEKILDKYGERFFEINQGHMKEVATLFNSLREELSGVLTPGQMRKMFRRGFLRPGRFPGRPGGRRGPDGPGFPGRFEDAPEPGKRAPFPQLQEKQKEKGDRSKRKKE
jgi:hypothetical protein